jgi:IS30 family transposase
MLVSSPRLRREVERRLRLRWSPQQISARLVLDYPDDPDVIRHAKLPTHQH